MEEFVRLSQEEQIGRLEQLGRNALAEFGVEPISMTPLVHIENTTFRVHSDLGDFCLRISRPGYQSNANIRSEIALLDSLVRCGFQVPRPWQPRVVTAQAPGVPLPRDCVLFHWVEGEIHRKGLTPDQARQVGELTARLHGFVETWPRPEGFDRQRVHTWLLDAQEPMAIAQPSDMVDEGDRRLLMEVVLESREMAASLPRDERWIRLIHSDLHAGNLVFRDGLLHAIDFDDTGYGFLIYDFASTLCPKAGSPEFSEFQDALLDGYARVRPLPERTCELLPQFLKLRLASIANWVASRSDNPELRQTGRDFVARLSERIRSV
jgi:Ser/Thr protein kinase RdoA (MazF antagonist)